MKMSNTALVKVMWDSTNKYNHHDHDGEDHEQEGHDHDGEDVVVE